MAISTSNIVARWDNWVREEHTDSTGKIHTITYNVGNGDAAANLAARVSELNTQLAEQEFWQVINGG